MFESSRLTLESAVRDGEEEEEAAAPRKHPGGYLRSEVAIIWLFIQLFYTHCWTTKADVDAVSAPTLGSIFPTRRRLHRGYVTARQ